MTTSTSSVISSPGQGPTWHTLSSEDALREQRVDAATGLSQAEAERRLKQFSPNKFAEARKVPGYIAFLKKYRDPMQIVLLVAAIVSLIIQQWSTALLLIVFALGSWNDTLAQTMAIATFCFASILYALESNDELRSVFSRETLESQRLIKMCGWSLLVLFLVTALDFMHRIFATTGLTVWQWVICIVFGSLVLWTTELEKFFRRRAEASSATQPGTEPVAAGVTI